MKADEIRNEYRWDALEPDHAQLMQIQVTAELAAQVAELNESRKPRWVNLSDEEPCLVDASRVVGLSSGMRDGQKCVIVRLRGTADPFIVLGFDHDEVRDKLGISEDWMHPAQPIYGRQVSNAEYAEMTAIIDVARKLGKDDALVSNSTGFSRENFNKLDELLDSFDQVPF